MVTDTFFAIATLGFTAVVVVATVLIDLWFEERKK